MYLTVAEFIDRYTEREAVLLTAEPGVGAVVNSARLERGLADASAQVDALLGRRFALPLRDATTLQPVVPDMIKRLTGDVARYLMTGTHVRETEAIRTRYKDAIDTLTQIADGKATVGVELALASSPSAPAGGSTAVRTGARTFGDWGGY
jgi:phage gp36-like protein